MKPCLPSLNQHNLFFIIISVLAAGIFFFSLSPSGATPILFTFHASDKVTKNRQKVWEIDLLQLCLSHSILSFVFVLFFYNRLVASNPPPVFDVITGMTGLPYDDSLWQVPVWNFLVKILKLVSFLWKRHSHSGEIICNNVQVFPFLLTRV